MIASSLLVSYISYENTLPKHAAWALHAGVMGAMLGPMCWMGGPLLVRAAWYTAAIVAGDFFLKLFIVSIFCKFS